MATAILSGINTNYHGFADYFLEPCRQTNSILFGIEMFCCGRYDPIEAVAAKERTWKTLVPSIVFLVTFYLPCFIIGSTIRKYNHFTEQFRSRKYASYYSSLRENPNQYSLPEKSISQECLDAISGTMDQDLKVPKAVEEIIVDYLRDLENESMCNHVQAHAWYDSSAHPEGYYLASYRKWVRSFIPRGAPNNTGDLHQGSFSHWGRTHKGIHQKAFSR